LLPGSPAINTGKNFGVTSDQRGQTRPGPGDPVLANGSDGSDIGAFEVGTGALPNQPAGITRVVTTTTDGGAGSLRDALAVSATGDAITFADNLGSTISLTNSLPGINGDLSITETNLPALTVVGNGYSIFTIDSGTVAISGLWLADGGGSIYNLATLALSDSFVVGSSSSFSTIQNWGSMSMSRCTVFHNSSSAIYNHGAMVINSSALSANTSESGGAIYNDATAQLWMTNSTIAGNSVNGTFFGYGFGGGIFNGGNLTLSSCTICSNSCSATGGSGAQGGGIFSYGPLLQLQNTIVAGNSASSNSPDILLSAPGWGTGLLVSQGYNLIGATNGSTGWIASDLLGSTNAYLNPLVAPLNNNGGPTMTMALQPGSPALDQGKSFGLMTDQRGSARPSDDPLTANAPGGDGSDIGAFEVRVGVNLITTVLGAGAIVRSPNQMTFQTNATVSLTAVPATGWVFSGWSGDASGANNPLTVVMSADKAITANFTATASACDLAASGPVSWWPGGNNANDIMGTNNGTLVSGATFAAGKVGTAFSLNGSGAYVSIPHSPSLNFSSAISIEGWINTSAGADRYIITKNDDSFYLALGGGYGSLNKLSFFLNGVSTQWFYGTTDLTDSLWHHVAATYDGASMRLYVDGSLQNSVAATGTIQTGTSPVAIGARPGVNYFAGALDEISLYNRALSAAEVQAIYSAGSGGKCVTSPYITSVGTSGGNFNLSWLAQRGLTYRVQYKSDLNPATLWNDLSGDVTATGSAASKTDLLPPNAPARFYRIVMFR
jgi:uncharacterized repeat protein (TIGR02543 family)